MQDPAPENISGSIVRSHEFSHTIRWDYLVIGAVAGYVALKVFGGLSEFAESGDRDEFEEIGPAEVVSGRENTKVGGFADGGD